MISRNVIYIILMQFQINIINGFSLKDLAEKFITSAILNIIKESSGSNQHHAGHPLNIKDEINDQLFGKNVKSTIIKKIIPHGYDIASYGSNYRFKNLYRPLPSILMEKLISEKNIQEPTYKINPNKYIILIIRSKGSLNENSKKQFLDADKNVFHTATEKKLKDLFNKIVNKRHSRKIYTKSGEIHDPLMPGHLVEVETTTPLPKKWLPHYPYWNYWTYDNTLHDDNCPEDFLEMDGQCIEIPPH
ncbi:hypothetical protein O3G_MSEX010114 [Manduca sexta]|uniref:Uncharacterized protein n=1 Tax=Manduca sexta TaxID=7130 RepID=A0A921ZHH0_MANSE|nr:hypothetical protein O3G_MSEX010114 [Manduca sexta]